MYGHNTALRQDAAMSVYTELTPAEMQAFTNQFEFGALTSFHGVEAGVENTTYFVSLEKAHTVLQIFEEQGFDEIPFFIELNRRLSDDNIPVAKPLPNSDGKRLFNVKGKPAALFSRIQGCALTSIPVDACSQIGVALGQIHKTTLKYTDLHRENHRWSHWWERNVNRVLDLAPKDHQNTLKDQVKRSSVFVKQATVLPQGIIHGDLFCDNALFLNSKLTGIIDFYNACTGNLLFDLAITVNDWCSRPDGSLDPQRTKSLLSGYNANRPLTDQEIDSWPLAVETAALRFWMLRLVALARKREGGPQAPPHVKDPNDFLDILIARRNDPQCDLIRY